MEKSFTLIEFLIYIGIVGSFLILAIGFLWNIIFGNIKETAYQEVQQNARFVFSKMTKEIKKATGINNPLPGSSFNTLSLAMADSSLNPTVFDVAGGKLRITQGSSGPYDLTSNEVVISDIQFSNISYHGTPGAVKIEMTIEYSNPANLNEYQAIMNLDSTVSLFPGGAAP
jgi:Tfp pilus assembly protein PilW